MKALLRILSYPFSVLFYIFFVIILLLFDPIQRVCLRVFGYQAHKISVDVFNGLLILALYLLGTTFSFKVIGDLPKNAPVIIVSNHQSMWDISPLIWFLRKLHVKFIAKKELGNNIPTISYNLKYGGSALIDRRNSVQALAEIAKVGRYISDNNRAVVIFPEGTRSRDGVPKKFHLKGLETLVKNAPDAYILPVSINNSWRLQHFGMFPIPMFVRLKFKVHPGIKVSEHTFDELIGLVEHQIKNDLTAS